MTNQHLGRKQVTLLGGGFIGQNLAFHLLKSGFTVKILDRGKIPDRFTGTGIEWVEGNIDNIGNLTRVISGADFVFHLFSNTVPGDKVTLGQEMSGNIYSLSNVLDICQFFAVKRIFFLSSASVYGLQDKLPITENCLPEPISTHGLQKLSMEHLIKIKCSGTHLDYNIIRLSNPYGPGQDPMGRQGFIAIALGKILRNEEILIRGGGATIRDFIYIDDVCDTLTKMISLETDRKLFNLSSGQGESLSNVVAILEKVAGEKARITIDGGRVEDILESVLSCEQINRLLPDANCLSLYDGIKQFYDYLTKK